MPALNHQERHTVQTEIIELIADIAGIEKIGPDNGRSGTSVLFAGGKCSKKYLDGSEMSEMKLKISCISKDQKEAVGTLYGICNILTAADLRGCSKEKDWRICFISVNEMPSFVKKDDGGSWHYSCTAAVIYTVRRQSRRIAFNADRTD